MSVGFEPGGVVWVKCGSHYWPGEVKSFEDLPSHVKKDFEPSEEVPGVIVKFFEEDGYEFLQDTKGLFTYNCEKKEEFIKKGLVKSRRSSKEGSSWFSKFPHDIVRCEILTNGDPNILEKEPYLERNNEKVNYKEIFKSSSSDSPTGRTGRKRTASSSTSNTTSASKRSRRGNTHRDPPTNKRPISHPRFKPGASGASDHKIKILPQPSSPYHLDLAMKQEKAAASPGNNYTCSICGFAASRLNVIILHNKSHSSGSAGRSSGSPGNSSPQLNSRGRNGGIQSVAATPEKKIPNKKASKTSTAKKAPVKKTPEKKAPRLTKKLKEAKALEEEKQKVERQNKILDDWSDEEDDSETDETSKANKEGLASDDGDEEMEMFMGDDHLHQNSSDDEDEGKLGDDAMESPSSSADPDNNGALSSNEKKKSSDKINIAETLSSQEKREEEVEMDDSALKSSHFDTKSMADQTPDSLSNDKEEQEVSSLSSENNSLVKTKEDEKDSDVNSTSDISGKTESTNHAVDADKEEETEKEEVVLKNGSSRHLESPSSSNDIEDIDRVLQETRVPSLPEDLKGVEDIVEGCRRKPSLGMKVMAVSKSGPEEESSSSWNDDITDEIMPPDNASKKGGESDVTSSSKKEEQEPSTADSSSPKQEAKEEGSLLSRSKLEGKDIMAVIPKGDNLAVVSEDNKVLAIAGEAKSSSSVTTQGLLQGEEDTYILLVDDGSGAVDSLNSQTLYIDPNSLASGDLSNMVLMTSSSPSSGSKDASAASSSSNSSKDILALAIQQQHIVTTVDTSGGIAIVPGIASSSGLSKVPLISTQATPSAPLMCSEVTPTQVPGLPDSTSAAASTSMVTDSKKHAL